MDDSVTTKSNPLQYFYVRRCECGKEYEKIRSYTDLCSKLERLGRGGSILKGSYIIWVTWDYPTCYSLHGTARYQPLSGNDTENCDFGDDSDTEQSFSDGEYVWCV